MGVGGTVEPPSAQEEGKEEGAINAVIGNRPSPEPPRAPSAFCTL